MSEETEQSKGNTFSSFVKELFARRNPYTLVTEQVMSVEIEDNNPLKYNIEAYKKNADRILNDLNDHLKNNNAKFMVSREDFDSALKYLVPTELKPDDHIRANDGKITYQEIQEIAENIAKVPDAKRPFTGQPPRIFLLPNPPLDVKDRFIVDSLALDSKISGLIYDKNHNAIVINRDFVARYGMNMFESGIAHETGHWLDFNKRGEIKVEINPGSEQAISKSEISKIEACIARDRENHADLIAASAHPRYGNALSNYILNLEQPRDNLHPSSAERVQNIEETRANPELAKKKLAEEFAEFKKIASNLTDADHRLKTPVPTNTEIVEQCTGRIK